MKKINLLVFTLFLSLILWSGICAWLGFHNLALWPWSHQWYMFSYSSDFIHKVRAVGYTDYNVSADIPLEEYFCYPASLYTHRADEVSRAHEHLLRLTEFLCQKNPELTAIQVNQEIYLKRPGRISDLAKPSDFVQVLLRPTSCRSGPGDAP